MKKMIISKEAPKKAVKKVVAKIDPAVKEAKKNIERAKKAADGVVSKLADARVKLETAKGDDKVKSTVTTKKRIAAAKEKVAGLIASKKTALDAVKTAREVLKKIGK